MSKAFVSRTGILWGANHPGC